MEKFEQHLAEERSNYTQVSDGARRGFDKAYAQIRETKVSKKSNRKPLVAAAVVLLSAGLLSQTPIANAMGNLISEFGHFLSQNVQQNLVQPLGVQDVSGKFNITANEIYADSHQIGLRLSIQANEDIDFDNLNMLEFRLKNNGQYIAEVISDTQPLRSDNQMMSSFEGSSSFNEATKTFEYILLLNSTQGLFPQLQNVELSIENLNFDTPNGIAQVAGAWQLDFDASTIKAFMHIDYHATNANGFTVTKAQATPTGFVLTYSYPSNSTLVQENPEGFRAVLVDEEGNEFEMRTAWQEEAGETTVMTKVFNYTGFDAGQRLELVFTHPVGLENIMLEPVE